MTKPQSKRQRLTPKLREQQLVKAAVLVGRKLGLTKVHHSDVKRTYESTFGNCSLALVFNYLGDIKELHTTIAKSAIKDEKTDPLLFIDACIYCSREGIKVDSEIPSKLVDACKELRSRLIDLT